MGDPRAVLERGLERRYRLERELGRAYTGAYLQHQLARIYIIAGAHDQAIDRLEALLRVPYYLSPGWLRIDPNLDPLRKHPRFQALVAGS